MANTLKIVKTGDGKFWHYHNNLGISKFAISDFVISIDGSLFKIIEKDGAIRYNYLITDISVVDQTDASVVETFTDSVVLWNRLKTLNYTPFLIANGDFGFNPSEHDLSEFTNNAIDPFAHLSEVSGGATLDQVLTNGNESTKNAKIGELFLYDASGTAYGKVTINDGVFRAYNKDGNNIFQCENSFFSLLNGAFGGTFDISAITANHSWLFPNKSGTVALLDDVTATTTTYNTKFSYVSGAQEFTVPTGLKILDVRLNKAPLDLYDDYTIDGTTVTILPTLEANDQIVIIGII
jgi:hypothetical protein